MGAYCAAVGRRRTDAGAFEGACSARQGATRCWRGAWGMQTQRSLAAHHTVTADRDALPAAKPTVAGQGLDVPDAELSALDNFQDIGHVGALDGRFKVLAGRSPGGRRGHGLRPGASSTNNGLVRGA